LLASEEEERRGKTESEPSKLEKKGLPPGSKQEREKKREKREKEEIYARTFAFSWFLAIMVVRLAFDLLLSRRSA